MFGEINKCIDNEDPFYMSITFLANFGHRSLILGY